MPTPPLHLWSLRKPFLLPAPRSLNVHLRASTNRTWLGQVNHKYCPCKECAAFVNTPKEKQSVTGDIERFPNRQASDTVRVKQAKCQGQRGKKENNKKISPPPKSLNTSQVYVRIMMHRIMLLIRLMCQGFLSQVINWESYWFQLLCIGKSNREKHTPGPIRRIQCLKQNFYFLWVCQ